MSQQSSFQMEFHLGEPEDTGSYFKYFDSLKDKAEDEALEIAQEEWEKSWDTRSRSFGYFNPIEVITVREYSRETKNPIEGGHCFRLILSEDRDQYVKE